MNVVDHGFTPDYLKALEIAYKFYVTNEVYFHEDNEMNHTQYGWIKEEKATKHPLICFDEGQLKTHIIKMLGPNRYESAVSMWKELKILNVREIEKTDSKGKKTGEIKVLHTVQIKVNRQNTTVLQIPLRNFYEFLNISEDTKDEIAQPTNEPDYNEIEEYKSPVVNISPSSGPGFNQVSSVTANINDSIVVPDNSTNLHDLIMHSLTGDDR